MKMISKLRLCVALVVAAFAARADVVLLHHFPFDGDYRDATGGLTATPVPNTAHLQAPEFAADSPSGKGLSLSTGVVDGRRAGVLIPRLKLSEEAGTISMWVKSRAVASTDGASFIFVLPPSGNGGLNLALRPGSTVLIGAVGDSGPVLTNSPGELGAWRNIVLTWDIAEKKTKLYSNGALVKEGILAKGPTGNDLPARLGGFDFGNNPSAKENHFDGLISNLRIYRGAMSPAEVAREFSPVAGASPAAIQGQAAIVSEKITVARIFSSNMVLQRGSQVPVWGTGAETTAVTVEFAGQRKTASVRDGRWEIVLDAMEASATGRELRIEAAGSETVFKDVLVGDVWLATGQSNMQLALHGSKNPEAVIAAAQNQLIRHFITPMSLAPDAAELPAAWQQASSQSVRALSAVAYYFANNIQPVAGVPIGIVQCTYGGSRAEAWSSPELMSREWPGYQRFLGTRPEGFFEKYPQVTASKVYEQMLSPLFPFAVKGTIWYQGEGNSGTPTEYVQLFPLLIEEFRSNFRNADMPFYFVQLPRLVKANWAPIRQAQLDIWKATRNTFMAVTIDVPMDFEPNNVAIHPSIKRPVGERLAFAARHYIYGETALVPSGPRVISAKRDGLVTRITFDFAEGGLTTADGEPLRGLFGGSSGKSLAPLQSTIDGDSLIVDHAASGVADLKFIRYGSEADAPEGIIDCNLANQSGLPASPFMLQVQ